MPGAERLEQGEVYKLRRESVSHHHTQCTSIDVSSVGHTIKRCKQPVPGEDGAGNEGFGGTNSFGNDTGNGASSRTVEPTGDWTTTTPADAGASASGWGIAAPIASTGGW